YARWIVCAPEPRLRIYSANHASHLATVALWSALPPALRRQTRPVAARDCWGKGALRRLVAGRGLKTVLIDRNREQPGIDPLAPPPEALDGGDSLVICPDGTRNPEPELLPFRAGLYHLVAQYPQVE